MPSLKPSSIRYGLLKRRPLQKKTYFRNRDYVYAYLVDWCLWTYLIFILYTLLYQSSFLLWRSLYIPVILGLFFSFIFWFLPRCSISKPLFKIDTFSYQSVPNRFTNTPYLWLSSALIVATLGCGLKITELSLFELLSPYGIHGAKKIFMSIFSPDFSIIHVVLSAAIETIYISFMATVFAVPFAFIFSFFSSSNLMKGSVLRYITRIFVRLFLNTTRSIEPLVWAIIFSVWVGIGPFSGMLALMVHSIAALTKLYSDQIESINKGPLEMVDSTGAHSTQVIWFGVVPQIILPFLSCTIYRWDINLRMATIIGLVGGGGIGRMLIQYQGLAQWHKVGTIILVIAVIVSLMDYFSMLIRKRINV